MSRCTECVCVYMHTCIHAYMHTCIPGAVIDLAALDAENESLY
jgi:hypothetical protein